LKILKPLGGQVCLVTGAAKGIGAAIARMAAEQGASVVINYRTSETQARQLADELQKNGHTAVALQANVAIEQETKSLFDNIKKVLGEVDLLVNNAGVALRSLLQETSLAEWEQVMDSNLKSAFLCCREALPSMIRKKYGRIVNIASIQGIGGASYESVYAASKGGLIALTRSLGSEVAPCGITVNALAPGAVATEMLSSSLDELDLTGLIEEIPAGRLARPEEIASACLFLLSPEAGYINGQVLSIDGAWKTY
jgi:3-oxoacyl-[acyl-carrier protein] reductase